MGFAPSGGMRVRDVMPGIPGPGPEQPNQPGQEPPTEPNPDQPMEPPRPEEVPREPKPSPIHREIPTQPIHETRDRAAGADAERRPS